MANLLTTSGDVYYSGVTFNHLFSTRQRAKPVYDDAGRQVKWVEFTLEVDGVAAPGTRVVNSMTLGTAAAGTTTDDTMEFLRERLTQPRGVLIYDAKGFGEFTINVAPVYDANWGPKPQLLEYSPIGNSQTAMVKWKVVTCIPQCPTATYRRALVMACHDVSHDLDSDGYVTATVTGAIEIPLTTTTASSRTVPDTVDAYKEMVAFPPGIGFKRESFKWHVSMDRRRGEFQIVDKEIPVPLPNGATMCDIKHRVASMEVGFVQWHNEISGTIRMTPTRPRGEALDRFLLVARSRIAAARAHSTGGGVRPVPGAPAPGGGFVAPGASPVGILAGLPIGFVIGSEPVRPPAIGGIGSVAGRPPASRNILFLQFEIEEDIFGRDNRFRLAYKVFTSWETMVRASGLWTPIDGTDFIRWRASISDSMGPRGHSRIRINAADDTLVDLCLRPPAEPVSPGDVDRDWRGWFKDYPVNERQQTQTRRTLPETLNPFLSWHSDLEYFQDDHIVRHKPLAGTVNVQAPKVDAIGGFAGVATAGAGGPSVTAGGAVDTLQRVNRPSVDVVLVGSAVRVGARIPTPELRSLAGKDVVETSRYEKEHVLASFGQTIYGKVWRIGYSSTDVPARIPMPMDPLHGLNGEGQQ